MAKTKQYESGSNEARIIAARSTLGEDVTGTSPEADLEAARLAGETAFVEKLEAEAREAEARKVAAKEAEAKAVEDNRERGAKLVPVPFTVPSPVLCELIAAITLDRSTLPDKIGEFMDPLDQPLTAIKGSAGEGDVVGASLSRAFLAKVGEAVKTASNGADVLTPGDVLTPWFVSKAKTYTEAVRGKSSDDFRIVLEFQNKLRAAARQYYKIGGPVSDLDGITPKAVEAYNRVVTHTLALAGHPDRTKVHDSTAAANAAAEEQIRRLDAERAHKEKQAQQARIDSLCGA